MVSMEVQIRNCREENLRKITEIEDLSFDEPYPYRLFVAFLLDFPEGFRVAITEDESDCGLLHSVPFRKTGDSNDQFYCSSS